MNIEKFYKIKQILNEINFFGYKNILLGDALTIQIRDLYIKKFNAIETLRTLLSFIALTITKTYDSSINEIADDKSKTILFYSSHSFELRKDHTDSMEKVKSIFITRSDLIGKKINRRLELRNLKLLVYLPIWIFQLSRLSCSFQLKIKIILDLSNAKLWYDFISKEIDPQKYSALIVHCDARTFDNILVQYLKLSNVPTATLQHGHFTAPPYNNMNIKELSTMFEGFVSDRFFVWGEYTKNEAIKNGVTEERIKIVGCPKYINYHHEKLDEIDTGTFGIVLDGGGEKTLKSNIEMINVSNQIAAVKNLKYVIKPHPVSDITIYEEYINKRYLSRVAPKDESVEEYAKTIDFSIAKGSSVYSELIFLEKIVYRFVSDDEIDRYKEISWGYFSDFEGLCSLIDLYESKRNYIYKLTLESKKYLFASGDVTMNYKNAINELISINYKGQSNDK
ncbi:MAG: hypothetical protein ACVCEJ_07195 [Candidatus Izemoplasmataceae bacterium]